MTQEALISAPARRKSFSVFFLVLALLAAASGGYWWWIGSGKVDTDNSYVAGDLIPVSAQVAGQVLALQFEENEPLRGGVVALTLDDTDAMLGLKKAQAALEQGRRRVNGLFSDSRQSQLAVEAEEARVKASLLRLESARVNVHSADDAYARRLALKGGDGAVSEEELDEAERRRDRAHLELDQAQSALNEARLAVKVAKAHAEVAAAQTEGVRPAAHPDVVQAEYAYEEAHLSVERTQVKVPLDGIIAKRYVNVGQRVNAGQALFSLVPAASLYIEANFKETQTRDLRPGQCAEVVADRYGKDVVYRAVVESVGVGTGSVFSRVPVQNAAGNWVKIVQRVPVRLRLDAQQLTRHPLSLGMSAVTTVSLKHDCSALLQMLPARVTKMAEGALASPRRPDAPTLQPVAMKIQPEAALK